MNNNNKYDYNWTQIGQYLKSLNLLNKWENMKLNFYFLNLFNKYSSNSYNYSEQYLIFIWIFDLYDSLNDAKIINKF